MNEPLTGTEPKTIPQLWENALKNKGADEIMMYTISQTKPTITWKETTALVQCFAGFLLSKDIRKGDQIGCILSPGPESVFFELGAQQCGIVTIHLDPNSFSEDIEYILKESEIKLIFIDNETIYCSLTKIIHRFHFLEHILTTFDSGEDLLTDITYTYESTIEHGKTYWREHHSEMRQLKESVHPDDIASIVYTRGTTGKPKGAMLSHTNLLSTTKAMVLKLDPLPLKGKFLSFLPYSNVFSRTFGLLLPISLSQPVQFVKFELKPSDNIEYTGPVAVLAEPHIVEDLRNSLTNALNSGNWFRRNKFKKALSIGEKIHDLKQKGESVPLLLRWRISFNSKFFKKIQRHLGGNLQVIITCNDFLPKECYHFFHYLGINVLETYGLSEMSSVVAMNTPHKNIAGSAGSPVPWVSMAIKETGTGKLVEVVNEFSGTGQSLHALEGEIWLKGKGKCKRYWNHKPDYDASLTKEGWLKTGDFGRFDNGMLFITQTRAGKRSGPDSDLKVIESSFEKNRYITRACYIPEYKGEKGLLVVSADRRELSNRLNLLDNDWEAEGRQVQNPVIEHFLLQELRRTAFTSLNTPEISALVILNGEFNPEAGEINKDGHLNRKQVLRNLGIDND